MDAILSNPWFQNVTSDFLTLLIILLGGSLVYHRTERSKLLKLFGLTQRKQIVLYLSTVRVLPGGSAGVDGQPRSFSDSALPYNEALLIPLFQRLFNFVIPGVSSQPGFLKWLLVSDVRVDALPSPLNPQDVENGRTFIAVGSPGYNGASLRIEQALHPIATFNPGYIGFSVPGVPQITDGQCSFVQRVFDQPTGQTAFYVAGMSSLGTTGAALFLANQWKYLAKKYSGSKPFCVVLRIAPNDASVHEVLFEKG